MIVCSWNLYLSRRTYFSDTNIIMFTFYFYFERHRTVLQNIYCNISFCSITFFLRVFRLYNVVIFSVSFAVEAECDLKLVTSIYRLYDSQDGFVVRRFRNIRPQCIPNMYVQLKGTVNDGWLKNNSKWLVNRVHHLCS